MKLIGAWRRLALAAALGGSSITVAAMAGPPTLPASGYVWQAELAPEGPVLIWISLPEQRAYVYRNGVRIGLSAISSGKPGYETPTGVFSILQKKREHISNLYDDAPMPFMQRLTWDGIALHAGRVPGYPASHGCVRLPFAFSEKLFGVTTHGITVLITDRPAGPSPAGNDSGNGSPSAPATSDPESGFSWHPELASEGPVTVLASSADASVLVLRNGVEIGRSEMVLPTPPWVGLHAYQLLPDAGPHDSPVLAGHPALRWQALTPESVEPGRFSAAGAWLPPAFAALVYGVLAPGDTLVLTDEALSSPIVASHLTVLQAENPPAPLESPSAR